MVAISSLTLMVTMVTSIIIFEDMEGREKTAVELMDGLSDNRPHPKDKVGGHQVHQTKVGKPVYKGYLHPWIPKR